jgi:hypothetical protein
MVSHVFNELASRGIGKGGSSAIMRLTATPLVFFALARVGAILVPVNPRLRGHGSLRRQERSGWEKASAIRYTIRLLGIECSQSASRARSAAMKASGWSSIR